MSRRRHMKRARATLIALALFCGSAVSTQSDRVRSDSYPNPYRLVENPLTLPQGRQFGVIMGLDIDPNGKDVWVFDTCGGDLQAPLQHPRRRHQPPGSCTLASPHHNIICPA